MGQMPSCEAAVPPALCSERCVAPMAGEVPLLPSSCDKAGMVHARPRGEGLGRKPVSVSSPGAIASDILGLGLANRGLIQRPAALASTGNY